MDRDEKASRLRGASIANLYAPSSCSWFRSISRTTSWPRCLRRCAACASCATSTSGVLSGNELGGVATWSVLASLPELTELDLSENRFAEIPSFAADSDSFAQLEFPNLSGNLVRRSEYIMPVQRLPRIAIVDLRRNAFLDEIWNSIKLRKSAQKRSQKERYEGVFVPRHCNLDAVVATNKLNGADADAVELPRLCDFGRIY